MPEPSFADSVPAAASRPGRLRIGVVSAGKVGAVLAAALRSAGHDVIGAYAVSEESQERAHNLLPGVPLAEPLALAQGSDLLLLAVPDDVLAGLVSGLAELGGFRAGQLVAHTSGRFGVDVLAPIRSVGAIPLAIHPAMTFTGLSLDLTRLTDCIFGVSADAPMLPIAQALVLEMGGEALVVADDQRVLYHAALAHGSNHLVTLVAQAAQLLSEIGAEDPARVLGPLLRASLENALASGESALTGPVARGDAGTVAAHREALTGRATLREAGTEAAEQPHDGDDILSAYLAMARSTLRRAEDQGRLRAEQAASVRSALDA